MDCAPADGACHPLNYAILNSRPADTPVPEFLYWNEVSSQTIKRVPFPGDPGQTPTLIHTMSGTPQFLRAYGRRIYFSRCDSSLGVVESIAHDGSDLRNVISGTGATGPAGFFLKDNSVYWVDTDANQIKRTDLDTGGTTVLITGLNFVTDLILINDTMYWADKNDNEIEFSDLNGNGRTTVSVSAFGSNLFGLGYDSIGNKVYWTQFSGAISRADPGIQNGESFSSSGTQPAGLAVEPYSGNVYSADFSAGTIKRISIGGIETVIRSGLGQPGSVAVIYEDQ